MSDPVTGLSAREAVAWAVEPCGRFTAEPDIKDVIAAAFAPVAAELAAFRKIVERGLQEWLPTYSREAIAEMGGRVLALMCGALAALHARAGALHGRLYGAYAQSSGSGNASVAVVPA